MIVKGLRVISDFEWEFQMNQLNRTLAPEIETVYVMASPQVSFVSSSGVKEIASFGGNVEELVPAAVARRLKELFPSGEVAPPSATRSRIHDRMDVLVLIDKLDDLVHNAKAVPLTDQVRIDREEIYDILDQMRATIPEEIKQARWIVKERQEMLAEAKREQDRLLQEAREQAVREASQTEIVKLAERQAQEIIDEARRAARETRLEMEDWADGILATLENNLDKFLTAVRRGRERLHERSQEDVVARHSTTIVVLGRACSATSRSTRRRRMAREARRAASAPTSRCARSSRYAARGQRRLRADREGPARELGTACGLERLPAPDLRRTTCIASDRIDRSYVPVETARDRPPALRAVPTRGSTGERSSRRARRGVLEVSSCRTRCRTGAHRLALRPGADRRCARRSRPRTPASPSS